MAAYKSAVQDCDCCPDSKMVKCVETFGMMMCEGCIAKQGAVSTFIAETRTIDTSIQVKTDIFNAKTVAAVELRGAIMADASIADDMKEYEYAKATAARQAHLSKVIFEREQQLLEDKNELRMWQTQTNHAVAKLKAEYQAHFKSNDLNYKPQAPKSVKPKAIKKAPKFDKVAVMAAAGKYGVPAGAVQMSVLQHHWTPDEAAMDIARAMGILPTAPTSTLVK